MRYNDGVATGLKMALLKMGLSEAELYTITRRIHDKNRRDILNKGGFYGY